MDVMRGNYTDASFKITEIQGDEGEAHHLVVVAGDYGEAAILRTRLVGEEYQTRFLMLPGNVVKAIKES